MPKNRDLFYYMLLTYALAFVAMVAFPTKSIRPPVAIAATTAPPASAPVAELVTETSVAAGTEKLAAPAAVPAELITPVAITKDTNL